MSQRFKKKFKAKVTNSQLAAQVQARFQQALALHQQGQLIQAEVLYEEILKVQPNNLDALLLSGEIAYQAQNLQKAVQVFNKAIAINPQNAASYNNRGLVLQELKQFDAALASYNKAIAIEPDSAKAYYNRGLALQELKQLDAALSSYNQAIAIEPGYAQAYNNRGNVLQELKQLDAALASYNQAIAIEPGYAQAYNNRGGVLQELKQLDAALASYNQAIAIEPGYAQAYNNRGNVLRLLKQLNEALANCNQAIALESNSVKAYYNRGNVLQELKQLGAALANYDKAIALEPDYVDAYNNRGNVLQELNQLDDALASYGQAITIEPDYAQAYNNRGHVLQLLKQYQAAIESYDKALDIKPDYDFLYGMRLHTMMQICDWIDVENNLAELIQKIQHNEKVAPPFIVLARCISLPLQRKAAEIWANEKYPANFELGNISKRSRGEKIRLGYFSMDFRIHPTSFLTAELFEIHDRDRFEIIAFSYGPDTQDEMRQRLEVAFDRFIEVRFKSDREIAELARQMEIDIAIDLAGHTTDARTGIFAMRAAPVQVNFLGYPGTMGADYMDYLIADRQIIPAEAEAQYSEKIVYLPNSYQINDAKRKIADKVFSREELGLPESSFVFCCFNNNYKITHNIFDGWMRILKQVEGSVLWLYEDSLIAANNLRTEAVQRGVAARRLVFAKKMLLPDHLARHRAADLFIDTLPYNAHTTASDALWAGLPVLTCPGEAFASRVAASLLTAIGLPELIATSQEEYEALAVELATNPERLKAIKDKLARNRLTTPLFDTRRYTRHLEDAFAKMYERCQAGLPPEHIEIDVE